ncbi:hypothetical protein F5I97DRAFT_1928995 [Phlebopus sp. FC_14]|nr:hypothetical protein F5I97DRAFT_1928995 [Phlebopus sp. FC_14]
MAYPLKLSETVNKMATQDSATLNWDVIVNYSVPAINQLLAETFKDESKKQIKDIKFDIAVPNPLDDNVEVPIHYKFGLASPLLSFNPRGTEGPTCNLSFPVVGGTVAVEGSKSDVTVPSGLYTLFFGTLNLRTASGTAVTDPNSDDQTYIFHNGADGKEGYVVIDLPTSKSLMVDVLIDESSKVTHVRNIDSYIPFIAAEIKSKLHNHEEYKHIRYEIARINAHTPPHGMVQLVPKIFQFDAFVPSDTVKDGDIGILTLFIQTRNTNHGTVRNRSTAWEAQWRTSLECSPIPKDKAVSIIFNKSMVYESVIKPALEIASFSGVGLNDTTGSFEVRIDTGKQVHRDKYYHKIGDSFGYEIYKAEAVDVTLPPLMLTLKEDAGSPTYATSWEWDYACKWVHVSAGPSGIAGAIVERKTNGTTTVTHTTQDQHPKVITLLDDYSLKMDCSVSKNNWDVEYKPEDRTAWERF